MAKSTMLQTRNPVKRKAGRAWRELSDCLIMYTPTTNERITVHRSNPNKRFNLLSRHWEYINKKALDWQSTVGYLDNDSVNGKFHLEIDQLQTHITFPQLVHLIHEDSQVRLDKMNPNRRSNIVLIYTLSPELLSEDEVDTLIELYDPDFFNDKPLIIRSELERRDRELIRQLEQSIRKDAILNLDEEGLEGLLQSAIAGITNHVPGEWPKHENGEYHLPNLVVAGDTVWLYDEDKVTRYSTSVEKLKRAIVMFNRITFMSFSVDELTDNQGLVCDIASRYINAKVYGETIITGTSSKVLYCKGEVYLLVSSDDTVESIRAAMGSMLEEPAAV